MTVLFAVALLSISINLLGFGLLVPACLARPEIIVNTLGILLGTAILIFNLYLAGQVFEELSGAGRD